MSPLPRPGVGSGGDQKFSLPGQLKATPERIIFCFGSFYRCSFVLINGLFGDFKVFFQFALRPDVQRLTRLRRPRHWCCGNSALRARTGKQRPGPSDSGKACRKRTRSERKIYME